ncbi:glycosyltransferase [Oscillibacter sp.]|uniref:glycosyltransferase n=1 Tax=Oscillibacter sp. TaxID=1945593 RepID=UPI0026204282|nr:glycosyltransferase [Oscillibacter sp.]
MQFHRAYLRAFQARGWEVHVACGGAPPALPEADRVISLPFEKKMTAPANFRAQAQLRRLMREEGYALVIAHTSLAAFFTRRAAAPLHPRPAIVNVAHGYLFGDRTPAWKRAILLSAEYLTAPQTDLLLTMNTEDYRTACRYHLGRRVENIPGIGVDFSRLDAPPGASDALRATYGFSPDDFVLLYAAEFSARKNQTMLIRALSSLPERVKLVLPGQGALLDDCRALAASLHLEGRVVFPGQVSDMAGLYALCDAAVSASRSEGLPFNVMESMYAGLPVVASAVKGHTDLLSDGLTGLLYPFGDAPAFCDAVTKLLEDPALPAALGRAAHEAAAPYALSRVLPSVMERYLSLVPQEAKPVSASH